MNKPKVSVCLIVYNHEKFLKQALDGILCQKTTFDYELIIGEDCSTDSSREICLEYQKKYPKTIKLLLPKFNLGPQKNVIQTISAAQGEYIALIEGDDYWTGENKLQLQVDLMEKHLEAALSYHEVEVIDEDGVNRASPYSKLLDKATFRDVINSWFIPTVSILFRKSCLPEFPIWLQKAFGLDVALTLLISLHGNILRLPNKHAVYRQHGGGISKRKGFLNKAVLRHLFILKRINEYSNKKYDKDICDKMLAIIKWELQFKWPVRDRFIFFKYYLYAKKAKTFREFRYGIYYVLIPNLYKKVKKRY